MRSTESTASKPSVARAEKLFGSQFWLKIAGRKRCAHCGELFEPKHRALKYCDEFCEDEAALQRQRRRWKKSV